MWTQLFFSVQILCFMNSWLLFCVWCLQATKFLIIVQLLLGEIPERSIFGVSSLKQSLHPYFKLTQVTLSLCGFPLDWTLHRHFGSFVLLSVSSPMTVARAVSAVDVFTVDQQHQRSDLSTTWARRNNIRKWTSTATPTHDTIGSERRKDGNAVTTVGHCYHCHHHPYNDSTAKRTANTNKPAQPTYQLAVSILLLLLHFL